MAYWHMQIRWAEHQTEGVTFVEKAIEKKVIAIGSDDGSFLGDNPIPKKIIDYRGFNIKFVRQ